MRRSNCRQQQQTSPVLSFQDGGPPGLNIKLDGEASYSRRQGKPTKGPRYTLVWLYKHSICITITLITLTKDEVGPYLR